MKVHEIGPGGLQIQLGPSNGDGDASRSAKLILAGELDLSNADSLEQAAVGALAEGATKLTLDFEALEFIDSTGIALLFQIRNQLLEREGKLVILDTARRSATRRVLEVTGFPLAG